MDPWDAIRIHNHPRLMAIAAAVGAIMSAEWALWVVCAVAGLGAAAFGFTALRARAGSDAPG